MATQSFTALTIRKGHKKSIVALAQKMLRMIYAMLGRHAPYQDRAVDYEALTVQRNAPRWIKMLVKYGFIKPATAELPYEAARDSCVLG